MAKYFLIAGEASGDKHAAELIKQLMLRDSCASFAGLGGDRMAAAGCRLYQNYRKMAFMVFAAVLRNLGQIHRNFRIAEEALIAEKPDALILIDYPTFNLRIASFCRKHLPQTRIYYYIPPKVWAWKRKRIHTIAKLCDRVLGIFPFEPAFYARYGYECTYVGNPTAEEIAQIAREPKIEDKTALPTIALLPGSRESEVKNCLPVMLEAARRMAGYQIVVTAAPALEDSFYMPYMRSGETLTRETYTAVRNAQMAVVNSGTATLETALLGCPQVAVYYLACSWFWRMVRWAQPIFFTIRHFTLVNILAGKEVIKELVANDFTADKIEAELHNLEKDEEREKIKDNYAMIQTMLGESSASQTAAKIITEK